MARQGTVAPTHFNVIWDRTGFVKIINFFFELMFFSFLRLKVDHMQQLTQKLCHLYYK
jgi:hypothetical protein